MKGGKSTEFLGRIILCMATVLLDIEGDSIDCMAMRQRLEGPEPCPHDEYGAAR